MYVTVEAVRFYTSASSQHGSGVEEPHSLPLDVHPLSMPRLCLTILNHVVQLMIWTTPKCWAPPRHMTWEGLVTQMNMSKPIWTGELILMLAEMCTKSSLI